MKLITTIAALAAVIATAPMFCLGTSHAEPQGEGSVRCYDSRGNSLGTPRLPASNSNMKS
jgi:hypothetical protein